MCPILNGYWYRAVWVCLISRPNYVRFLFVGLDGEWSLQKKGGYPRRLLTTILDAATCMKKVKINSDEQHAIFAHKVQRASRLMVGFSNIYFKL